jgi:hypothetical protein
METRRYRKRGRKEKNVFPGTGVISVGQITPQFAKDTLESKNDNSHFIDIIGITSQSTRGPSQETTDAPQQEITQTFTENERENIDTRESGREDDLDYNEYNIPPEGLDITISGSRFGQDQRPTKKLGRPVNPSSQRQIRLQAKANHKEIKKQQYVNVGDFPNLSTLLNQHPSVVGSKKALDYTIEAAKIWVQSCKERKTFDSKTVLEKLLQSVNTTSPESNSTSPVRSTTVGSTVVPITPLQGQPNSSIQQLPQETAPPRNSVANCNIESN